MVLPGSSATPTAPALTPSTNLGRIACRRSQLARSEALDCESLELFRSVGSTWGAAVSIVGLAHVAYERGLDERAAELYAEGLNLLQGVGSGRR